MLQRDQSKPAAPNEPPTLLQELLELWHGDKDSMGWASPTLALNIAQITKPTSAKNLAEQIYVRYKDEQGNIPIPEYDKELIQILHKGFKLYRGW